MDGERELRPSPLIAGAAPLDWTPARPAAAEPLPQESLDDRQGPPLAPGGRGGGGLDVLDTQARNPCGPSCATASAAARWRPADVAAISVRGQFLHRALELAWGMLPDQDALHAAMAEARVEPCWSRPWRRPPTRP